MTQIYHRGKKPQKTQRTQKIFYLIFVSLWFFLPTERLMAGTGWLIKPPKCMGYKQRGATWRPSALSELLFNRYGTQIGGSFPGALVNTLIAPGYHIYGFYQKLKSFISSIPVPALIFVFTFIISISPSISFLSFEPAFCCSLSSKAEIEFKIPHSIEKFFRFWGWEEGKPQRHKGHKGHKGLKVITYL
jgi:hypothetical protein